MKRLQGKDIEKMNEIKHKKGEGSDLSERK
jgi:hypothetical protein